MRVRSAPFSAATPNLPTKAGLEGARGREIANSQAPIRNPPIRNPRNPWLLASEKPGLQRAAQRGGREGQPQMVANNIALV
eukprot:10242076-Alexandrium_andersonii.AAC.1